MRWPGSSSRASTGREAGPQGGRAPAPPSAWARRPWLRSRLASRSVGRTGRRAGAASSQAPLRGWRHPAPTSPPHKHILPVPKKHNPSPSQRTVVGGRPPRGTLARLAAAAAAAAVAVPAAGAELTPAGGVQRAAGCQGGDARRGRPGVGPRHRSRGCACAGEGATRRLASWLAGACSDSRPPPSTHTD
jgi:hypothetical protein